MSDKYAEKIEREYTKADFAAAFGKDNWRLNSPGATITLLDSGKTLTAKEVVEAVEAKKNAAA